MGSSLLIIIHIHTPMPTQIPYTLISLCRFVGHPEGPGDHSVLWNAMIYPFLNMTIKGAIWYQGEANSRKSLSIQQEMTNNYQACDIQFCRCSRNLPLHIPCYD